MALWMHGRGVWLESHEMRWLHGDSERGGVGTGKKIMKWMRMWEESW